MAVGAGVMLYPPVVAAHLSDPLVNNGSSTISKGMAVSISGGGIAKASAADNTKNAFGIAINDVAAGAAIQVQFSGGFSMTDWTSVTGAVSLTSGAEYFLSPTTPGMLTTASPGTAGQVIQYVGMALTTKMMIVGTEPAVLVQ